MILWISQNWKWKIMILFRSVKSQSMEKMEEKKGENFVITCPFDPYIFLPGKIQQSSSLSCCAICSRTFQFSDVCPWPSTSWHDKIRHIRLCTHQWILSNHVYLTLFISPSSITSISDNHCIVCHSKRLGSNKIAFTHKYWSFGSAICVQIKSLWIS